MPGAVPSLERCAATTPAPPPCASEPVLNERNYDMRCAVTVPAQMPCAAQVEIVRKCGKARLHMTGDGCSTTCVRMVVDRGQTGPLKVAAGQKHIHVHGKKWKAHADHVQIGADGRVVLCGHVKLISDKIGVCTSVKAEKLCIQVKHGCLDCIVEP